MQNRKKLTIIAKIFFTCTFRLHANQVHVHVNSFAGVFVLRRKQKATSKWPFAVLAGPGLARILISVL